MSRAADGAVGPAFGADVLADFRALLARVPAFGFLIAAFVFRGPCRFCFATSPRS